ncbi:uncharacterized protein LOC144138946 [Haemaphysalis longicornis]
MITRNLRDAKDAGDFLFRSRFGTLLRQERLRSKGSFGVPALRRVGALRGGARAHEYSAAFSHRPKIPCTPCSPTKQGARFNAWLEDAGSSPAFTRVQRRRASEAAALLPWPGKRGAMAQGPLGRCSSMPAARDCGPGAAKALSLTCVLDEAFIASPSPTQALSRNTLLPREVADFRRDENSPPGAKTRPRKSAFKSRPSEAGRKKAANRVTFFVKKGTTPMAGDAAGDVTNMAIPPAESGDGQWERGGGDGPQDGEGGPRPQRSALLDVAGARPTGNPALHPKQDHCVDEKLPQARKSRGKRSQGLKEATDPKQPAPLPQRSAQWSPARGGSRGCCPLFLVGGRRQPSSEVVRAPGTQHRQVCYLQRGEPDCETAAAIDVCASSAVVYIIACS